MLNDRTLGRTLSALQKRRRVSRRRLLGLERLERRTLLSGQPPVAFNDLYTTSQGDSITAIAGAGTTFLAGGSSWAHLVPASNPAFADTDFNTTWMLPTAQFNAQYNGPAFSAPATAPIGYGDPYQVTTVPTPPSGSRGAGYFRHDFTISEAISNVQIDLLRDDGGIVYLDGAEIGRSNMGNGADTWNLPAGPNTGTESDFKAVTPLTINTIAAGTHTLAVSIHNAALDSSDLGFDLRLKGATGLLGVLANDTDPENDTLTVSLLDPPDNAAAFTLNPDGSFEYTPVASFRGPSDTFTYQALDGTGTSNVATVTINIIPDNFSPVVVQDRYTIVEDNSLSTSYGGTTLIDTGATWKYLDDGNDLLNFWIDPDFFDDDAWPSGAAELGYGEGDEATVVSFGPDPANKYVTTYFRHEFNVADPGAFSSLSILMERDDGMAVYLNGSEILRDNLAPGAAYNTFAIGNSDDDGQTFIGYHGLSAGALRAGTNLLAVEMHQSGAGSSDISFDLKLIGATEVQGTSLNDTDRENDDLSAIIVTPPPNAQSFTLHPDGSFDYTPNLDFAGTDSFVYKVNDGTSDSGNATVSIVVTPVNDIPLAVDDFYSVAAGGTLTTVPNFVENLITTGDQWRYLDNGSNQGTAWRAPDFDDSSWSVGASQLGYGEGDEATVVSFGPDSLNKYATTYMRHTFQIEDVNEVVSLAWQFKRDDAISVFLNGTEIYRDSLLPGVIGDNAVLFNTRASGAVADDGQTFNNGPAIDIDLLETGDNVLAVEVHQANGDSSDLTFDLILDVTLKSDGVTHNDFDPDSPTLTVTLVTPPEHAQTFGLAADGSFTYVPEDGYTGPDSFTYFLNDGIADSNIATVNISVGEVLSLVVTNTNDSGAGSLRAALSAANGMPGPNVVTFEIPGGGPHLVNLASNLPALVDPVTLDLDAGEAVEVGTASTFTFGNFGTLTKAGAGSLTIGGNQSYSSPGTIAVDGGSLRLASSAGPNISLSVASQATFLASQKLAGLSIGPAGTVTVAAGSGKVIDVTSLAISTGGVLDLTENDLIVRATPATRDAVLASVTALLKSGLNGFAWTGPGINSSTAAADPTFLTAVGVMLNDNGLGDVYYPDFSGVPVTQNDILAKFTYYGDGDISGVVDGTDYALIDNGFNSLLSGWFNGDFDYTGPIDGTDYALIDNAFNAQGPPLAGNGPLGVGQAGGPAVADESHRRDGMAVGVPMQPAAVDAVLGDWPNFTEDELGPLGKRRR